MIDEIPTAADESENDIERVAAICSILSSEHRVAVIDALESGVEASITQIVEGVATDCDDDEKYVSIGLYQTHLPQLAALGFVEYTWETGYVRRGPQYRLVRSVLDAVRDAS